MEDNIRIVSVDPGNGLGVAALDFDLKTRKFKVLDAYTLDLSRYIPNDDETDKRDISLQRLAKLQKFLKRYLKVWRPDYGAHETAYVPHRGGGASIYSFASLVENILTIKFSFISVAPNARIFEVNPTTVKTSTVGFKSSDKSLVLKALIADEDIDLSSLDMKRLNQHNCDAIAIGVTAVREYFNLSVANDQTMIGFRGKKNARRKK